MCFKSALHGKDVKTGTLNGPVNLIGEGPLNYSPDRWSGLSTGYTRLTQRTGGKYPLVTAVTTDFVTAGRKSIGYPTENGWGTVSVRVNDNRGRKRGGRYLRIPPFSSSLFRASIIERTSGEGVLFFLESPAV